MVDRTATRLWSLDGAKYSLEFRRSRSPGPITNEIYAPESVKPRNLDRPLFWPMVFAGSDKSKCPKSKRSDGQCQMQQAIMNIQRSE